MSQLQPVTIYKLGEMPVRGLRTAIKPAQLRPGEFSDIDGYRWNSGALTVRKGLAVISATIPWTTLLGAAAVQMNGTNYIVAAGLIAGDTAVYALDLTTGFFLELTTPDATPPISRGGNQGFTGNSAAGAGVAGGGTRLPNPGANVTFTVHTTERRVSLGVVIPPVDVLSIQNLEDYPMIYSPGLSGASFPFEYQKVHRHKPIQLLSGCSHFNYFAYHSAYLQIGTAAAARAYYRRNNAGATQTRWFLGDTSAAPYNAAPNFLLLATVAAAQDGDTTHFKYQAASVNFIGEEISFLLESTAAGISDWTQNYKLIIAGSSSANGTVAGITAATPAVVNAGGNHFLSDGDAVWLEGTGTSGTIVSGLYYAKITTVGDATHFGLYHDPALTVPITAASTVLVGTQTWANAAATVVYDSSSTDPTLTKKPIITPMDLANNRQLATYRMKAAKVTGRSIQRIAFQRNGLYGGTSYTLTILTVTGTGLGNGFPGDTEWAMVWRDRYSYAESAGFVGDAIEGGLLVDCGGPTVVRVGTGSVGGTVLPTSANVLYDFIFNIVNPGTYSFVYGGLNGLPTDVDFYFRTNEESLLGVPHSYWATVGIYSTLATGYFTMNANWYTPATGVPKAALAIRSQEWGRAAGAGPTTSIDRDLRDTGVPLPAYNNVSMPRASAVAYVNQRTFVGCVQDDSNAKQRGDLYISCLGFPFRFQAEADSDISGTRTVFSGETIQRIIMTAAAANGASTIYVVTNRSWNALGTAGGFVGSGYDTTSLGIRVQMFSNGTNEPMSIVEFNGLIYFIDNFNQIQRLSGGNLQAISRNEVDNLTKEIPASRRGLTSGVFFNDRYLLAFTASGETSNRRVLGRNDLQLGEWEFLDRLPSGLSAARLLAVDDSNLPGSGRRLLMFSDLDGKVYGYEEGASEPGSSIGPNTILTCREFQSADLNLFRVERTQVMADAQAATLTRDVTYKTRQGQGVFQSTIPLANAALPFSIRLDTQVPDQTSTGDDVMEGGWSAFISLYGHQETESVLWRWECLLEPMSGGAADRGLS